MRRAARVLAVLLAFAAAAPAWAQLQTRQTMQSIDDGACTAEACSATTARYCVSGAPPALHVCNTATGFYIAVGSAVAGSNTQVQFNDSSALGGDAGLTYNKATDVLTISGGLTVSGGTSTSIAGGVTLPSGNLTLTTGNVVATAGSVSVPAGQKVLLEGSAGDTYFTRDPDTGYVLVYIDGALRGTVTPRGLIPGACPSNLRTLETGTECVDAKGRRVVVTAAGATIVRGALP